MGTLEGHTHGIACFAACDKEGLLRTGSGDDKRQRWHFATGELLARLEWHTCGIIRLAAREEGLLFTGFHDETVKRRHTAAGQ